jgi:hypothetical protein
MQSFAYERDQSLATQADLLASLSFVPCNRFGPPKDNHRTKEPAKLRLVSSAERMKDEQDDTMRTTSIGEPARTISSDTDAAAPLTDQALLDVLTKRAHLEAAMRAFEEDNITCEDTTIETEIHNVTAEVDEVVLDVLTRREQLVAEGAVANENAQKHMTPPDVRQSNLNSGPRLQTREDECELEEQLRPPALHRSPHIEQQPRQPGAYMGAPGSALHRNEDLRFSLVGVCVNEHLDTGQVRLPPVSGNHQQLNEETPNMRTRTISNTGLVEARVVTEESTMNILQEAQQVDVDELGNALQQQQEKQCRRVFYALLVFAICVLAISLGVTGVTLVTRRDRAPASDPPNVYLSMEPSQVPSSAPTGELDALFTDLPNHTRDNIQKGNTPQYQAWEWLSRHQNVTNLPEWRKKQLFALATFFYSFEGENWNPLIRKRWMEDTKEECLWFSTGFGRFVDGDYLEWPIDQFPSCNIQEEFTWLELQDLQLSGLAPSIPPEIVLLTSLSTIALYQNGGLQMPLTAILPSELYQMSSLKELWLYGNNITGHIPRELGLMTKLTLLEIDSNLLSGPLPSELGKIANMAKLHLFQNALSGWLPTELGLMTSLTELALDGNRFSGLLPSELGRMTELADLWLHSNRFSGAIPSELGSTNLTLLNLGDNMFSGGIPHEIWQLSHWYYVDLYDLPMLTGPIEMSLMPEMGYLDLSGSFGLSGTMPNELCSWQNPWCTFFNRDSGEVMNCSLIFNCTALLCGCDCPCPNASLGVGA